MEKGKVKTAPVRLKTADFIQSIAYDRGKGGDAMKVVLIVLGVLVLLSALVLYACVVVGARYDRQSERWREEQEKRSDRSDR